MSTNKEWLNKLQSFYAMEYFCEATVLKNEVDQQKLTWQDSPYYVIKWLMKQYI